MYIPSSVSGSLDRAQSSQHTQSQRLASGLRINSAKDDAAGLAITTRLDSQNQGNNAAIRNSLDGISRLQVEDAALGSVTEDLQRIRELKVQQNNGVLTKSDSQALHSEIEQRLQAVKHVFNESEFNGQNVFKDGQINIQSGPNGGDQIEINTQDMSATIFSDGGQLDIAGIDSALEALSARRSELGAVQSTLQNNTDFLALKNEANQAASSRIRDTDFAKTVSEKSKDDVQLKVAIAVQGQANAQHKDVLRLLKG
jgi:flagellin